MDLRILSNYVATDIYALFKKFIQKKFRSAMFKTEGGLSVVWTMFKKLQICDFPNVELETFSKFAAERVASSSIRFRLIGD